MRAVKRRDASFASLFSLMDLASLPLCLCEQSRYRRELALTRAANFSDCFIIASSIFAPSLITVRDTDFYRIKTVVTNIRFRCIFHAKFDTYSQLIGARIYPHCNHALIRSIIEIFISPSISIWHLYSNAEKNDIWSLIPSTRHSVFNWKLLSW